MVPQDRDDLNTLPKVLRSNYKKNANLVAMREKDQGLWNRYLWRDYYEKAKLIALGLADQGLKRGDKVALLGETKPEIFWAELAVLALGGVAIGIFSDCVSSEVQFYLQHSDSRFVFAEDQEQVDKILEIRETLPNLKTVIYWDPKGLWFYDDPLLMNIDRLQELGKKYEMDYPSYFENMIEAGTGEETAIIIYTSGTTGKPKGAMINHLAMVKMAAAYASLINLGQGEEWVAFMSIAWIGGQMIDLAATMLLALVVNFPEKPETVQENIREIGARGLLFSPKQWEATNRMIQGKMGEAFFINRIIYKLFLPIGLKKADSQLAGRKFGLFDKLIYFLANLFVFRPLKDKIGLKKIKVAFTGGTAVSPDILRFYHGIGICLKQLYGSSEMGLLVAHQDRVKPETCGTPLPGVEIRISDQGEVLARAPWGFSKYYKNEEAISKVVIDGWYHTGDFGHLDGDGHLMVMDRMEDVRLLAGGRRFAPQYTETRIRFSPFIKEAIVVGGEDKEFVSAIINIDLDNTGYWAEKRKISYTTFADLSQKPEIIDLVKRELRNINQALPEYARIRRFVNLHKEFDPDEAELTRSRKLRRAFLEERYADLVAGLYGAAEEISVRTEITYQDGKKGSMIRPIKIVPIE
jgi:long-chain acyl-CoA synthetase